MEDRPSSLALPAYRLMTRVLAPVVPALLTRRELRGKEDPMRRGERFGIASAPRPEGTLIWIHAASVGESLSVLPLIDSLIASTAALHVLVTTGTVTSAKLMRERLPARATHQYVPLDHPSWCARFLDYWEPDLGIWVESEFWPNLIVEASGRGIPLALVNARITEKSFKGWRKAPGFISNLLSRFDLLMAQDKASAARLRALGAAMVLEPGNLKHDAAALPHDAAMLGELRTMTGNRPLWLASNTHPGEERTAAEAHLSLAAAHPRLLTVIVPRHPARGPAIARELRELGLAVSCRSRGEPITDETQIYLGDTLGEMGLFYSFCDIVFIGGTLDTTGGHNPFEAALLQCALVAGPSDFNFAETYAAFTEAGAMKRISSGACLALAIAGLLEDPEIRNRMANAARAFAISGSGATQATADALLALLPGGEKARPDHA
ncbi:MAG: 3-deoxy-D-manno-octulosonic acid transferase [Parvibaculaceae bacterium]|nr:3-deoxy-D-manno-octulosonic acid transferase [Parvibaculaceae bacterium]